MGSTCHLSDRLPRRDRLKDALMWFFTSAGRLLSCPFHGDAGRDFDVIDGGFRTKPALGLKEAWLPLCGSSRVETQAYADPVPRYYPSRIAGLLRHPRGFFLGTNDVAHPDPQRCLLVRSCCGIGAGEGFNNGFFQGLTFGYFQQDSPSISVQANVYAWRDYSGPPIQSHKALDLHRRTAAGIRPAFTGVRRF
jgi:hypothetical protein